MTSAYKKFIGYVNKEDREASVKLVLELLNQKSLTLLNVYEELLIPAMKEVQNSCSNQNDDVCMWQRQFRLSVLKTVVECTYPFVIENKQTSNGKKVLIISPQGEYSEIGALIATNFFTLAGYKSYYLGANTPSDQVLEVVKHFKPHYLTIGIYNFYNAIATKQLIDTVLQNHPTVKIIGGGPAFSFEDVKHSLTHHFFVKNYRDIFNIEKELK